jgi:hypothetical protein
MNGSFQNYVAVVCGAGLAFLTAIISSAVFARFDISFRENWLWIIFFSSVAILILLWIFQRSIGITLEEYTFDTQNIENIMVNFEERIERIFEDNTKVEVFNIWKIKLIFADIIVILSILIWIFILYFISSFMNIFQNEMIVFVFIFLFLLTVKFLGMFVRKWLKQYVYKTEYYWKLRSILFRDPRECHVEFYNGQNRIKVKYFYDEELFRVMEILEDSGLPLRIRPIRKRNLTNN